jgi:hypothetical protein
MDFTHNPKSSTAHKGKHTLQAFSCASADLCPLRLKIVVNLLRAKSGKN